MPTRITAKDDGGLVQLSQNRIRNANGHIIAENSVLTAEEVSKYLGKELMSAGIEGLDPDQIYGVYRPAAEIIKALPAYNGIQLLDVHEMVDSYMILEDKTVGSIGTSGEFRDGKLYNTVSLWKQSAIDALLGTDDEPQLGLSVGYDYVPIAEEGQFNGEFYQFIQTEIKPNHVAMVKIPRVKSAQIADSGEQVNDFTGVTQMSLLNKLMKTMGITPAKAMKCIANDEDLTPEEKLKAIKEVKADDENSPETPEDATSKGADAKGKDGKARDSKGKDKDPDDKDKPAEDEDVPEATKRDNDIPKGTVATGVDTGSLIKQTEQNMAKRLVAFDGDMTIAETMLGKLNREAFALDSDKVLEHVLKTKGVAFDGMTTGEKRVAVRMLQHQITQSTPKRYISANDGEAFDVDTAKISGADRYFK